MKLSEAEISALYGEDYFHGQEYRDYAAEEQSLRFNFAKRLAVLSKLIPDHSQKTLFEIGSAYGFFLEEAKHSFSSVAGIDISQDAIAWARQRFGLDVQCGDYLSLNIANPLDVIVMWDTIEHLSRPDLFIEKMATDLKSGGHIAITTGDIGSINARLRGQKWRMIHPPTHLQYFSAKTLRVLLERQGFDIVHISWPGNSRKLKSILYHILVLRMKMHGLYNFMSKIPLMNLDLTLNLYDIMYVVAKKR